MMRSATFATLTTTALFLSLCPAAMAQIANPPLLLPEGAVPGEGPPVLAAAVPDDAAPVGEALATPFPDKVFDLKVTYIDGQIYNPATGKQDKVRLRGYTGTGVNPDHPYVSPTIETVPSQIVRVTLDNQLPEDPTCGEGHGANDHNNKPHCFNGTNLHTHGLWVNPSGNGDNVLLSINPQTRFTYEYAISSDHPSGTFWYHTHRHGSTALQVSSGMAGALIIRGDRKPMPGQNGDLDTLIPVADIPERIMVMQQIQYACRAPALPGESLGPIKQSANGQYYCDEGDIGGVESAVSGPQAYDLFGPGAWPKSGRYTSINGEVFNPAEPMTATQGQVERWRMIHAGVRDTISLRIAKVIGDSFEAAADLRVSPDAQAELISESCSTDWLPYSLVAADGLTMAAAQQTTIATFQPGYRFDALVVFPEPGRYCMIDASAPAAGTVNGLNVGPQLLAVVDVAPGTEVPDIGTFVKDRLVGLAEANMPADMVDQVVADLQDGMKLSHFVPHPDITDDEVKGVPLQELTFFIDTKSTPVEFEIGNTLATADTRPYDPGRIDRALPLGKAQEWKLQSHFVSHPFHIHVNPFQIVEILDPFGRDVSAADVEDYAGGPVDPQYRGLKGVWKDTLWTKSLLPSTSLNNSGIYTITIRTRYERYIGEYVLHCHILDHEDQGMMQNVAVVLPDQVEAALARGTFGLGQGSHDGH